MDLLDAHRGDLVADRDEHRGQYERFDFDFREAGGLQHCPCVPAQVAALEHPFPRMSDRMLQAMVG